MEVTFSSSIAYRFIFHWLSKYHISSLALVLYRFVQLVRNVKLILLSTGFSISPLKAALAVSMQLEYNITL